MCPEPPAKPAATTEAEPPAGGHGPATDDPVGYLQEQYRQNLLGMPPANVMILGKTGVGKSTLINAVFGESLFEKAETGVGRPVTRLIRQHKAPEVPLALYDTPGVELGQNVHEVEREFTGLIDKLAEGPDSEWLHVLWYCIRAEDRRFEEFEEQFLRSLHNKIPIVLVLTQTLDETDAETRAFIAALESRSLPVTGLVPTLALPRNVAGHEIPAGGLEDLVAVTVDVLPDAVRRSFINAQKVGLGAKERQAKRMVKRRVERIDTRFDPFRTLRLKEPTFDIEGIAEFQLDMLARVSSTFGLVLPDRVREGLVIATVGGSGVEAVTAGVVTLLAMAAAGAATGGSGAGVGAAGARAALTSPQGKAALATAVRFLGKSVDETIRLRRARTLSEAVGYSYVAVCKQAALRQLEEQPMTQEDIISLFQHEYETRLEFE